MGKLKMSTEQLSLKQDVFEDSEKAILSKINEKDKNISVLKRSLDIHVINSAKNIIKNNSQLNFSKVVNFNNVKQLLNNKVGSKADFQPLYQDVSKVVLMFSDLFNVKNVWLRLDAIDGPMCPRFHVDNVKCRLVSTYFGPGTEWLPNNLVNRNKLGHGNNGELDEDSGLFIKKTDIQQLEVGHLGLLKGEGWKNNQGCGLVHRSPEKNDNYKRLYMTIDFVDLYLKIYKNRLNRILA